MSATAFQRQRRAMAQQTEAKSAVPDRDDIDRMPKAEVKEWLEAHGVEGAKGRIDEMREQLKAAMFI